MIDHNMPLNSVNLELAMQGSIFNLLAPKLGLGKQAKTAQKTPQVRLSELVKGSKSLDAEQHLFRQEDEFKALYLVQSGAFKSYRLTTSGKEVVTGLYFPGDVIGVGGLAQQQHFYSVSALQDSRVCEIPFARLLQDSVANSDVLLTMLSLISQEFSADQHLRQLPTKSIKSAVASLLLNLSSRLGSSRVPTLCFELPMSRADIANLLGVSSEAVCREFTRLKQEGVLEVKRKKIYISDIDELYALANE